MSAATIQHAFQLALQHHQAGRLAEAEAIYRQLLAHHPGDPELLDLLGVLAHQTGHFEEALTFLRQALAARPGAFLFQNHLGLLFTDLGRFEEAAAALREAARLQPDWPDAHYNLGNVFLREGRAEDAIDAYRTALRLRPDDVPALNNLGHALTDAGQPDAAIAHYRAALQRHPAHWVFWINLGNLLKDHAQLDAAVECYRTAGRLCPDDATPPGNLGVALHALGALDAAVESFRRSLSLDPNRPEVQSNLIFTSCFHPEATAETIAKEQQCWNQRHAAPLRSVRIPHSNDPSPPRRLRIGYVSGDLREHAVGRALLPVFEAHDRAQCDLICYSGTGVTDSVAGRFRDLSTVWRETALLTDERLAAQILGDRIDILVDLSLHTAGNRLPVFARKPAPVQLSWLGYPGTSGLDTMDYRITDPYLEPEDRNPDGETEQPLRLPDCWTCYAAPADSPQPGELPASRTGCVTFGSFNSFAKLNENVFALWARILRGVEGSRLMLLSKGVAASPTLQLFQRHGVEPERISFANFYTGSSVRSGEQSANAYLDRYRQIDIALDPFPYNGMTTTCDALWMGVPVVALIGETPVSRASFSLLSNVGLPELAANTEEQCTEIATGLARDLPRLAELRSTLRNRMKNSPLLDATRFARNLEAAFRMIWQRWCAAHGPRQGATPPASLPE